MTFGGENTQMKKIFKMSLSILLAGLLVTPAMASGASGNVTEQEQSKRQLWAEEIFLELYETFTRTLPAKTYFQFKEAILDSQKRMGALGTGVYEDGGRSMAEVEKIRDELMNTLEKLLSEKSYKRFLAYEKTLGARNRLIQMKRYGDFLIPDEMMREKLILAMADVDRNLRVPSTPSEQMEFFKDGMNEETAQRIIELNRDATKAYLSASERILTPKLNVDFKAGLDRAARFLELGLNHQAEQALKSKAQK